MARIGTERGTPLKTSFRSQYKLGIEGRPGGGGCFDGFSQTNVIMPSSCNSTLRY